MDLQFQNVTRTNVIHQINLFLLQWLNNKRTEKIVSEIENCMSKETDVKRNRGICYKHC